MLLPRSPSGTPARPALRALLVDLSASVTRTRPDHATWLRGALVAAAREAREAREDVLVVTYAADVQAAYGPDGAEGLERALLGQAERTWHPEVGASGDLASDLCAALELARAELLAPGRAAGRVDLFGDGAASDGDARALLESLALAGVRAEQHALPERASVDLALSALVAPRELEVGAPLSIAVELELAAPGARVPAGEIALSLELVHAEDLEQVSERLVLPSSAVADEAGRIRWTARVDFGALAPGRWEIDATARWIDAEGDSGDPIPENDTARAELRVEGSLLCALVASDPMRAELGAWLADAPGLEGVEVLACEPEELPSLLADLDLVVTADVGPAELPGAALASFVRAGGAWIAFDGWRALGSGGVVSDLVPGEAAALLPLRADPRSTQERDVLLVVDGSGSMQGEPYERVRAAVHELALQAPPNDRVEMRFFTGTLGPIAFEGRRGQSREERAAAASALLAARVPGGTTDVLAALEELARLRAMQSTGALVLLLTDGRTAPGAGNRAAQVRASLARARAELRVIAIGAQADEEFLATLLLPGESLVHGRDLVDLGDLLAREVHAERLRAGPDLVASLAPEAAVETPLARELRASWSDAFARGRSIARYERAELHEDAEAVWTAERGEPLLALRRVGRGWVAACTSSPSGGWAPFLADEPGLLAPLLSSLARERAGGAEPERMELAWEDGQLVLDGVPPGWPPQLEARFTMAAGNGGGGTRSELARALLSLPPHAPGRDPRAVRVAPQPILAAPLARGEPLEVELWRSEMRETLTVGAPLPAELSAAPDPDLAADLPAPEEGASTSPGAAHPLAVPVLGLGLGLLFLSAAALALRGQAAPVSGRH